MTKKDDGSFIITGGLFEDGSISDEIIQFKLANDTLVIESRTKMPFGIYGHTLEMDQSGTFIFIGGVSNLPMENDRIIKFHPETGYFEIGEIDQNNIILAGHNATYKNGEILLFGGGLNCFVFGTYFNPRLSKLTPGKKWRPVPNLEPNLNGSNPCVLSEDTRAQITSLLKNTTL